MGNKMLVGNYLAIAASLLLPFKRWRLLWWPCLLTILLADNKAGLLAMMTGASVWLALSKSKLAGLPIVGLCLGLVMLAISPSDGGRFAMWAETWSYFVSNNQAYTGYGLGSINDIFRLGAGQRAFQSAFAHPHNEYLWAIFELGLIGFGLIATNMLGLFNRCRLVKKTPLFNSYAAAFASVLIICLFSFPLHVAPLGLVCLFIYSGLESLTQGVTYVSA
jgi:O-antigen ligase